MKRILSLSLFLTVAIFSLFACKKPEPVAQEPVAETQVATVDSTEEQMTLTTTNTNNSSFGEMVIAENDDYTDFDYYEGEDLFTITKLELETKPTNDCFAIYQKAEGAIAGLSGTFIVYLPYTETWELNDRALVTYKKAFDIDNDRILVTDIVFVEKSTENVKSRKERLAEEKAAREVEEAARLAEEEALAAEEKEKAEQKAKEEKEWAEKKAAIEKQRRDAELQALQAQAEAEQAERDRIAAEEEAKKTKVIYSPEQGQNNNTDANTPVAQQ